MLVNKKNRYFHITPKENLESILDNGLIPKIGERSMTIGESKNTIFLFPSFEQMNDALCNWFGDQFDGDEELAILQIDLPESFPIKRIKNNDDLFYESYCFCNISGKYITGIFNEDYSPMTYDEIYDKE